MILTTDWRKSQQNREQALFLWFENDKIIQLALWACQIENHYSPVKGLDALMDIEWAKDNLTQKTANVLQTYKLDAAKENILLDELENSNEKMAISELVEDISQWFFY